MSCKKLSNTLCISGWLSHGLSSVYNIDYEHSLDRRRGLVMYLKLLTGMPNEFRIELAVYVTRPINIIPGDVFQLRADTEGMNKKRVSQIGISWITLHFFDSQNKIYKYVYSYY